VTARLVERFIFNFRLRPQMLAERLPVDWLDPLVLKGWSLASFCVLDLDRVTLWPVPPIIPIRTVSCAYRCGVVDASSGVLENSVYITDRNTDRPIIARLGPLVFADTIPSVNATIARSGDEIEISISHVDGQRLFSATASVLQVPADLRSQVFDTIDDFSRFIKGGVSSYSPSVRPGLLTRVDLAKEDMTYEALDAEVDFNALESLWRDANLELDCVVRATGGRYRWTYRGTRAIEPASG